MPEQTHIYQSPLLDSTRWDHVRPRPDDIVVATPYKSGTTWMQNIVLHLIFQDLEVRFINSFSPWVDNRVIPLETMLDKIETQDHRRCLKSHLPLDGLRFFETAKYIVVGRDPRDVFMSLWNHYSAYTPEMYRLMNETPGRVGPPMPECPDDIHAFWNQWINQGWFEWETEGYPHWSNFRHVQTWWNYRHMPNILFVHYNDLLEDLPGEIGRIADFLEIACPVDTVQAIADLVSFDSMKRDAEQIQPDMHLRFKGGARTFINKGTNGRWRSVLNDAELDMYRAAAKRELADDCHAWIENGGAV